jgi:hypothetical protein
MLPKTVEIRSAASPRAPTGELYSQLLQTVHLPYWVKQQRLRPAAGPDPERQPQPPQRAER